MPPLTITKWVQEQLKEEVKKALLCIDATAGKGQDTLFLLEHMDTRGKVIAFDIQQEALDATLCRIKEQGQDAGRLDLILDGHEHMEKYAEAESVDVIMFNLGYLPGGSHKLATHYSTTIQAIEKGLVLLKPEGIMSICIYSGGDSGFEEREEVLNYLQHLNPKRYTVLVSSFFNKPNHPPIPVFIQKHNGEKFGD